MAIHQRIKIFTICLNITVAMWVAVMFLLFPACSGTEQGKSVPATNRDSMAAMRTVGVESYISDSGVIRYKIIAEEWMVYDKLDPPFWAFEKGLYLEQFNEDFSAEATIKADTAYYYDKKKLWELRSNVHIENQKQEKFDTDLLFWDEYKQEVYSDKKIRIEQADKVIVGYGFKSNQQLTDYVINNTEGIFYIEEDSPESVNDTLVNDSI
ncbi:MAG: LPS export ABC transporter periplasmic protein LptC [Bacteroidaceae bacterium]|nr:LPS export ABC transporter periplasmic protein LptC [Bacteroidaceae bacterium]MBR3896208.1 LPS export ABC transporter periplasmic protein LptC [Bacteroidaceae bacterium]